jgi:sigma-B regulation protein RsbU (phosphoserine phosphatase)
VLQCNYRGRQRHDALATLIPRHTDATNDVGPEWKSKRGFCARRLTEIFSLLGSSSGDDSRFWIRTAEHPKVGNTWPARVFHLLTAVKKRTPMNSRKPVSDWATDFDYLDARPALTPNRVCSQGIVTMRSTDQSVCDDERAAMRRIERDSLAEGVFDSPLLPFCFDDLTCNERGILEHDLTVAARVQQTLLPSLDFSPAGWDVRYHYAPAGAFGGDYCDLVESKAGLLFLLGDVSGKGVAASMLMSHLHATFRSLADGDPPLDLMVEAANRIFVQSTLAGQFATLVVGRAAGNGSVDFVSAGHLPLLRLHRGTVRFEFATGIPLGLLTDARFPARRFSLDPGDTLLVCTDGVTEARNSAGEEYGIQRLKKMAAEHPLATPSQLISECLADLSNFTGKKKRIDDLALLAIRRTGQAVCEVGYGS